MNVVRNAWSGTLLPVALRAPTLALWIEAWPSPT